MSEPTFGPYTPIVQAGDTYYVSGQIGVSPETKQAVSDVGGQTDQALKNLAAVLQSADLSMKDVVKTTVFLTNMGHFAAVNEVYQQHFEAPRPARSCIAVRELPRVGGETELLVEIEAVAFKRAGSNA